MVLRAIRIPDGFLAEILKKRPEANPDNIEDSFFLKQPGLSESGQKLLSQYIAMSPIRTDFSGLGATCKDPKAYYSSSPNQMYRSYVWDLYVNFILIKSP